MNCLQCKYLTTKKGGNIMKTKHVKSQHIGREFAAGREATSANAQSTGDRLISYRTCVAFRVGGQEFKSNGGFSATTRRHLSGASGVRVDTPFHYGESTPCLDWQKLETEIEGKITTLQGKQARAKSADYTCDIEAYRQALAFVKQQQKSA